MIPRQTRKNSFIITIKLSPFTVTCVSLWQMNKRRNLFSNLSQLLSRQENMCKYSIADEISSSVQYEHEHHTTRNKWNLVNSFFLHNISAMFCRIQRNFRIEITRWCMWILVHYCKHSSCVFTAWGSKLFSNVCCVCNPPCYWTLTLDTLALSFSQISIWHDTVTDMMLLLCSCCL